MADMPLALPPLSLYVHFPWCVRKCPYCDFNSYTLHGELPEERYVAALIEDMEHQIPATAGRALISVFLGGGTPSLFSPAAIERVLSAARATFGFTAGIEVTLEANPGTIERGRFAEYRAGGVNRVSLGAQSFEPRALQALGRIHSPEETCRAAEELHAAGLTNFNLDLMYALPGQDGRGAAEDIERAIALDPAHVSHYQLTIEAGTVFAASPPPLPSDDAAADMLAACHERLAAAGFEQYETSAHAREGRMARHNCNYWTFGDYVGVGAGAHGKLTDAGEGRIIRSAQTREPRRYVAAPTGSATRKVVEARDLPFEFMLNALRLTAGFDAGLFETRTGLSWSVVAPTLVSLQALGLMACAGTGGAELSGSDTSGAEPSCAAPSHAGLRGAGARWRPTALGARFLNDLLMRFLPGAGGAVRESHAISGEAVSTGV